MAVSLFSPVVLAQESFNEEKDKQTEVVEEVVQEEETEEIQEEKNHEQGMEPSEEKDTEPAQEDVVKLEDLTIHDKDGNELKEDEELIIKDDEKVEITAIGLSNKDYQWQISNPNSTGKDDKWIDIQDETEETLKIDYALIKNVLVKDTTEIRVRSAKNKEHFSTSFKVKVEESQVEDKKDNQAGNEIVELTKNKAENEEPELGTYSIVINYNFEDGTPAAPSYTATVANNTEFKTTVKSPDVQGYKPDNKEIIFDKEKVTGDITETVTYSPAEVEFTVKHLFQNINDDGYTEGFTDGETSVPELENKTGYTEAEVGDKLAEKVPGFYALNYDKTVKIAADGSTEIQIKYDREYYLMQFDLNGGYGVEPIYARYQSPITTEELNPEKAGYTFGGWDRKIPTNMPAVGSNYKAIWTAKEVGYTVIYWYENADDDDYSYAGQSSASKTAGNTVNSADFKNTSFSGKNLSEHQYFNHNPDKDRNYTVKGDGTTVVNVYFSRNEYTISFNLNRSGSTLSIGGRTYTGSQYSFTAKYNSDISDKWPTADNIPNVGNWQFYGWPGTNGTLVSKRLNLTADLLPSRGSTRTYSGSWSRGLTEYKLYYMKELLPGEEPDPDNGDRQYPRIGINKKWYREDIKYTQTANSSGAWNAKEIAGATNVDKELVNNGNYWYPDYHQYFYYDRDEYTLDFNNPDGKIDGWSNTLMFERSLADFEPNETPPYPSGYEKDAYEFVGWSKNPVQSEDEEAFDFANEKMPDGDLALYANWARKERKVNFFLTDEMNENEQIGNEIIVRHGDSIDDNDKPEDPENGKYDFVGWFYKDKEGKERAFDLSMPVTRDLNLYAKWTSNVIMDITINYKLEDGTTEIAPSEKYSGLAGDTKTYPAKFGEDLNERYQEGYFPKEASHSITIDIDERKNEYTFIYVERKSVPYTVRYLEEGTEETVEEEKYVEENRKAVVTEEYKRVKGYRPDAYQKRLILSAEGTNILTFYYVKDDVHAPIKTTYYQQNIEGDNYREVRSEEDLFGKIGKEYSAVRLVYDGFTLNSDSSGSFVEEKRVGGLEDMELTKDGLEFKLYYDRKEYPYEFQFLEEETNKKLADSVTGLGRYKATIPGKAKDIPGYTAKEPTSKSLKIDIEEPADQIENNIHRFFYKENEVTLNYEVIGPENSGKVTPKAETVKAKTGTATGSTAEANEGYRFIGWFKDEEGKEPVNPTWIDSANKIRPQKEFNEIFEPATYYAKFEKAVADLTIVKSGAKDVDENQSFIFNVKGTDDNTNDIDLTVTILGNGNLTVKDLPIGSYTVTEQTDWSWRYTTPAARGIDLSKENKIHFENQRKNNKWLSGDSYRENIFE